MKLRIVILLFLLLLPGVVGKAQEQDGGRPVFISEIKPSYDGGSAIKFQKWVEAHQQYPRKAREAGIEGRVITQFTITQKGKLKNAKVVRGVNPPLDREAVRVIKAAPQRWTPGKNLKGEPINVKYTCPVTFELHKDDSANRP